MNCRTIVHWNIKWWKRDRLSVDHHFISLYQFSFVIINQTDWHSVCVWLWIEQKAKPKTAFIHCVMPTNTQMVLPFELHICNDPTAGQREWSAALCFQTYNVRTFTQMQRVCFTSERHKWKIKLINFRTIMIIKSVLNETMAITHTLAMRITHTHTHINRRDWLWDASAPDKSICCLTEWLKPWYRLLNSSACREKNGNPVYWYRPKIGSDRITDTSFNHSSIGDLCFKSINSFQPIFSDWAMKSCQTIVYL